MIDRLIRDVGRPRFLLQSPSRMPEGQDSFCKALPECRKDFFLSAKPFPNAGTTFFEESRPSQAPTNHHFQNPNTLSTISLQSPMSNVCIPTRSAGTNHFQNPNTLSTISLQSPMSNVCIPTRSAGTNQNLPISNNQRSSHRFTHNRLTTAQLSLPFLY